MFISFVQLPPPNSIDRDEAAFLGERLRRGTPSGAAVEAAEKIEQAASGDGTLWRLSRPEVEAIVAVLDDASSAGEQLSERLAWIARQLGQLLRDETAFEED